ncbi:MAG TPA: 3-deoxy-manno-octulosonate cytidylyltransferase [Flavisolibacter sp.]|nr:3-deoxy-manno-octulosonate cytidylyltransferase [Flavisolibacter sp.]
MRKIAMIPARYAASRFPGKLMQKLGDRTIIARVYEATRDTGLFDDVVVVTDSEIIFEEISSLGGKPVRSKKEHESGTDRIAEAAEEMDVDIILNVQGDTPFIKKAPLEKLLGLFDDPSVQVGSLMQAITEQDVIADPNRVKVCVDRFGNSLFFSRSIIPFPRNQQAPAAYYEHIGVYAFRKKALLDFTRWPVSPLEDAEKIECLRYLENGVPLRMAVTDYIGVSIDSPADLEKARTMI